MNYLNYTETVFCGCMVMYITLDCLCFYKSAEASLPGSAYGLDLRKVVVVFSREEREREEKGVGGLHIIGHTKISNEVQNENFIHFKQPY